MALELPNAARFPGCLVFFFKVLHACCPSILSDAGDEYAHSFWTVIVGLRSNSAADGIPAWERMYTRCRIVGTCA